MDVKCLRTGNFSILHSKNGDTNCGTVICSMFNLPVQVWVIPSDENISTLIRHYRYWRTNKRGKNVLLEISLRISFSSWRCLMREGRRRSRIFVHISIRYVEMERRASCQPDLPGLMNWGQGQLGLGPDPAQVTQHWGLHGWWCLWDVPAL